MTCPICNDETSDKYRPFCSKRCADIDLGKWLTGGYSIPAAPSEDDESLPEIAEHLSDLKH
jgi:endogenous inhibitor of DNA gyrase (YacG/DUF329 family)